MQNQNNSKKYLILALIIVVLVGAGVYFAPQFGIQGFSRIKQNFNTGEPFSPQKGTTTKDDRKDGSFEIIDMKTLPESYKTQKTTTKPSEAIEKAEQTDVIESDSPAETVNVGDIEQEVYENKSDTVDLFKDTQNALIEASNAAAEAKSAETYEEAMAAADTAQAAYEKAQTAASEAQAAYEKAKNAYDEAVAAGSEKADSLQSALDTAKKNADNATQNATATGWQVNMAKSAANKLK